MPDDANSPIYRILDASANRVAEGLRTMEDFARFVLNDGELTSELKSLRHDLAAALGRLPRSSLLVARDTTGDVGTEISLPSESQRHQLSDVVSAAAERCQQSLRVLEEYGKTIDPRLSSEIEQIRYRSYTAHAQLELKACFARRHEQLASSRLYVLIDTGPDEQTFSESVTRLAEGAVDIFQLRDRSASDRTLVQRARLGTKIAQRCGKLFIMNDRADLAAAADTDGVHVGQTELPAADARRLLGPWKLIGVSTHSIAEARQAVSDGADYIGCGPVFPGRTKSFDAYVGVDLLRQVAGEIDIPAFAIGGIDQSNLTRVIDAGFRRVAVTGAVRDAGDPVAASLAIQNMLKD